MYNRFLLVILIFITVFSTYGISAELNNSLLSTPSIPVPVINNLYPSLHTPVSNNLLNSFSVKSPAIVTDVNNNIKESIIVENSTEAAEINAEVTRSSPIIANHTNARLTILKRIPPSAISNAKKTLKIFYAHTSHGSQITTGMSGLSTFAGAPQPSSQFKWNNGGINGALNLADYYGDYGDLGHNGDRTWAQYTRNYLKSHPSINVVMWSWCGGVSDNTASGINTYLSEMNKLEKEFPKVTFVYMTGHLDGTGVSGNLNVRNNQIRNYCRANNKVLFDFADIESYNPDNVYYLNRGADDACNFYSPSFGNWARSWQNSHKKGTYWYDCESAHSEPLNANLKAYAAWWMWAKIAGWDGKLNPYPVISRVSPSTGSNTKNLTVNIAGAYFRSNPTVKISRGTTTKSASSVQLLSSTLLKCVLPIKNASPGWWNLTVQNIDGTKRTKVNAFKITRA